MRSPIFDRDGERAPELARAKDADRAPGLSVARRSRLRDVFCGALGYLGLASARHAWSAPRPLRRSAPAPRGEERGVDRAWLADRKRSDRNARRHLNDRQKAVLA